MKNQKVKKFLAVAVSVGALTAVPSVTASAQEADNSHPADPEPVQEKAEAGTYGTSDSVQEAKENLNRAENDAKKAKASLDDAAAEREECLDNLESAAQNAQNAQNTYDKAVEDAKDAFDNAVSDAETGVEQAESNLNKAEEEKEQAASNITEAEENLNQKNEAYTEAQSALEKAEQAAESAGVTEETTEAAGKEAETAENAYNEATATADKAGADVESSKDAYDKATEDEKTALNAYQKAESEKKAADGEVKKAENELAEAQKAYEEAKEAYEAAGGSVSDLDIDAALKALKQAEEDYKAAQEAVQIAKENQEKAETAIADADQNVTEAENAAISAEQDRDKAQSDVTSAQAIVNEAMKKADEAKVFKDSASQSLKDGMYAFFESVGATDALDALENCYYADYNTKGYSEDASSFKNVFDALDFIDECNRLRKEEGLSELKVTDLMMACAIADANFADHHIAHPEQFNVGENLAWGYSNPFDGWYDEEKALYEGGNTKFEDVGHYLNIINGNYLVTGFAINTERSNMYGVTYCQVFSSGESGTVYSVSEYRNRLQQYYNSLVNAEDAYEEALSALQDAQRTLSGYEEVLEDAEAALTLTEADLQNAKELLAASQKEYQTASDNYQISVENEKKAQTTLESVQEDYAFAFASVSLDEAKAAYDSAVIAQNKAADQVAEAEAAYYAAVENTGKMEDMYQSALTEYNDLKARADELKTVYDEAQAEYERQASYLTAISDAENELETAGLAVGSAQYALEVAREVYAQAEQNIPVREAELEAAKDKQARAYQLSYENAFENEITDKDFAYLNDYISEVKRTEKEAASAAAALQPVQEAYDSADKAYREAMAVYSNALADVAVCRDDYNNYLIAEEKNSVATVSEKKDTVVSSNISGTYKSVQTGDMASPAPYSVAAGVSFITALWAVMRRKRNRS